MNFEELSATIQTRSAASPDTSYTARLLAAGIDRIAQKVGEEGVEVVIAAKNDNTPLFVGEVADLIYHLLVLMHAKEVTIGDIEHELGRRHAQKT